MPYELIVQAGFDVPVEGAAARRYGPGDHVRDQDQIDAIQGDANRMLHVVRVWVDDAPGMPPAQLVMEAKASSPGPASIPSPASAPASA